MVNYHAHTKSGSCKDTINLCFSDKVSDIEILP